MNFSFKKIYILIILITIFISVFFIPTINSNAINNDESSATPTVLEVNPNGFVWPLPGYTKISSPFGKRSSPTSGASSSHSGIDIPAPQGTKFIAVADGEITFRNFLGAGGYTITLSFANFKVSYCHCDPNFIVNVGDKIKQGQIIGSVGPRYVSGVPGNRYHDSSGRETNGATTRLPPSSRNQSR